MRLDLEQFQRVTVGAVSIREEDGAFHFCKLTERQLEAFHALSEGLYNGGMTTTGIRLEFYTNSPWVKYAIVKSGVYEEQTVNLPCGYEEEEESFFSLMLPSHERAFVSFVEIKDGANLRPETYDCKMLFIGDSLTQGWHSSRDELSFAYRTSQHFRANSIIQGIGGAFYHPSTADRLDFNPDTVIVAYGTNDASGAKSVAEVGERCAAYLARLKECYPNAALRVITPPWRLDYDVPRPYGHVQLISDCIRAEAEKLGIPVIDGLTLMPHDPALLTDNVHPNDLGFACYAQNLIHALEALS